MSPEERDEEMLEEFLKGDSEIARVYRRDAGEEPGELLDARILARARREVEREHRVVHSPFARHWMVPTSLAAVLILTVSVVVLGPDPALESGAPMDRTVEPVGTGDAKKDGALVTPLQAPAEPAPRREQALEYEDSSSSESVGRARENQPGPVPKPDRSAIESVGKAGEKRGSVAAEADAPEALAPATGAASMAAPAALEESAGAVPAASVQEDPERWLRYIELLVEEQRTSLAKDSLHAFRARYPDFALPPTLVPLAKALDAERR